MIVNLLGLGLILVIVWYFFGPRRKDAVRAQGEEALQRITVRVKGGYIPDTIVANPGMPLEIAFVREEDAPCSDEVWFPSLGVKLALPAFETTRVRIPPTPAGRYPFTCGMNMLHGLLLLEPGAATPKPTPVVPEATETDPICGMTVVPSRAAAKSTAGGRATFFCSLSCRDRFEEQLKQKA